jgi:hypothetical protein
MIHLITIKTETLLIGLNSTCCLKRSAGHLALLLVDSLLLLTS